MRITVYDNGEVFIPDKLIGFVGETVRTVDFTFTAVTGATNYVLRLLYSDGVAYDVPITDYVAELTASTLRESGRIKGQWIAYAADTSGEEVTYTLVAKSEMFELIIGESIGDDVAPIPTYEEIMSAITELTTEGMTREEVITAIEQIVRTGEVEDLDTGFVTTLKEIHNGIGFRIWLGTTAEYNALDHIESNVMYIKTDDNSAAQVAIAVALASSVNVKTYEATKALSEIFAENNGFTVYKVGSISGTSIYPVTVTSETDAATVLMVKSNGTGFFLFEYGGVIYVAHANTVSDVVTVSSWEQVAGADSGWIDLPLNSDVASYDSATTKPKYRKIGKQVFLKGVVYLTFDSTYPMTTYFATLPEGFRPGSRYDAKIRVTGPDSPTSSSAMYITPSDGKAKINQIFNLNTSTAMTTGTFYAYLSDCTFLID